MLNDGDDEWPVGLAAHGGQLAISVGSPDMLVPFTTAPQSAMIEIENMLYMMQIVSELMSRQRYKDSKRPLSNVN